MHEADLVIDEPDHRGVQVQQKTGLAATSAQYVAEASEQPLGPSQAGLVGDDAMP